MRGCLTWMTILGSIQDGLSGEYTLLATKSHLDGFVALTLAASMGWGVLCAALTVLIYQEGLTLGAGLVKTLLTEPMIVEMTAIRIANFLPALAITPVMVALVHLW